MAIDNQFGKGIGVAAGFDLGAQKPLDARVAVNTVAERDAHVTENRAYEGMLVYVAEDNATYQLVKGSEDGSLEWKKAFDSAGAAGVTGSIDAAKTELQGKIDAEKSRAEGVEAGLDGRLDVIEGEAEGSIKKAVSDEATLRKNADDALAARVKVNEDKLAGLEKNTVQAAIDKAEADAKAHAEQKIADLVDSAPEDLNTLKELAQAISDNKGIYDAYVTKHNQDVADLKAELQAEIDGDVKVVADELAKQKDAEQEGTLAHKIAAEVTRATGKEGELSQAITKEAQDRAEAVAGEKSRAEAEEGKLSKAITKEAQDRAEAVAGEKSRAEGVEQGLQSAIDDMKNVNKNGSLAKQISDEVTRAKAEEADIRADFDAADDALEARLQAEIDADVKVVADNLAAKYAEITGAAATETTRVNKAIQDAQAAAEKVATDGDAAIRGEMTTEATRVNKKIADDIAAESALRVAEEGKLSQAIAKEVQDRQTAINGLKQTHDSEMDAAEGRIAALEAKFGDGAETVESQIAAAKTELQGAIKEVADNLAAQLDEDNEESLQGQINGAMSAIEAISTSVDTLGQTAETNRQTLAAADEALDGKITTLRTDMVKVFNALNLKGEEAQDQIKIQLVLDGGKDMNGVTTPLGSVSLDVMTQTELETMLDEILSE